MKNLNFKRAIIASLITYTLGVSAFLGSFFVPIMSNPEMQANVVLGIAIIPAAILGAHFYYKKRQAINGLTLGVFMFLITMILDALITVPFFVIPAGGDHISFFLNPGFWMIGLEYILAIVIYWRIHKANNNKIASSALNGNAGNI